MYCGKRWGFAAALLPRLFGNNVPGHTTREPPVGLELATNGIQFYAITNLDKTSLMYCGMYWLYELNKYQHIFNSNRYVFNTYHLYWHASDGNNNLVLCMYSHSIQWHPQYMPIRRNVLACITIHNNTYQSVLACIAMLSCTYKIVVCANTDPIRTCIFNMCQYWSQYIHHHYPSTSQYRSIQTHTHTNTAPIQTNTHNVVFKICTSTC